MTTIRALDATAGEPLNGGMTETLRQLETTIAARSHAEPGASYVAMLNAGGAPLMARKFGEEAVELIVAALAQDQIALVAEAADVLFHLLVLLNAKGVALADVEAVLTQREGRSGLAEKSARNQACQ